MAAQSRDAIMINPSAAPADRADGCAVAFDRAAVFFR